MASRGPRAANAVAKLDDPRVMVVGHPAPVVRVAIGEEFGGKPGELRTGQLLNAMEKAGFTNFDVNLMADQTIIEEGTEFEEGAVLGAG